MLLFFWREQTLMPAIFLLLKPEGELVLLGEEFKGLTLMLCHKLPHRLALLKPIRNVWNIRNDRNVRNIRNN